MARPEESLESKFWKRVKIMPSGCWEWTGIRHRNRTTHNYGYGILQVGPRDHRKNLRANRISWELHYGPIPEGMFVLHKCDNKQCVNPEHLELGTSQKNIQDAYDRGLKRKGEDSPCSKLTKKQVEEIRNSMLTNKSLAEIYKVSQSRISNIKNYKGWRN